MQLTRDLFAIAKFLFLFKTHKNSRLVSDFDNMLFSWTVSLLLAVARTCIVV